MFPLPDTAQLYYFPIDSDTKTADASRRHLYRSYDLDSAKIRKRFEISKYFWKKDCAFQLVNACAARRERLLFA